MRRRTEVDIAAGAVAVPVNTAKAELRERATGRLAAPS